MDFKELSIETWRNLDRSGTSLSGYKSTLLTGNGYVQNQLHLFVDEKDYLHFAIQTSGISKHEISNPDINGLKIIFSSYLLTDGVKNTYIDIYCYISSFVFEFTEVVREITENIIVKNFSIKESVNSVIEKWKVFWASPNKNILSEEKQVGLICELSILKRLCNINSENALNKWTGPLGGRNDFNFTEWTMEIKGTRDHRHIHTINGIDQLKPLEPKKLALVSFLVSESESDKTINLQNLVEDIIISSLKNKPHLVVLFNKLISEFGYNPLHAEEYRKFKVEITEGVLYIVDKKFPKLTSDKLKHPLDSRVSNIRYEISLEGLPGRHLNEINLGEFFY